MSDILIGTSGYDYPEWKVVEFRHREWIKESVFQGLEKGGVV